MLEVAYLPIHTPISKSTTRGTLPIDLKYQSRNGIVTLSDCEFLAHLIGYEILNNVPQATSPKAQGSSRIQLALWALRSPLLGPSQLFSFPALSDMLKSSA